MSPEWLLEHQNDPDMLILHVGTEEGYDTLHMKGARFVDPYEFTVERKELRNQLPEMDSVLALLEAAGVKEDSKVVLCYESEDLITRTARVFLTLEFAGWAGRTFVLNGGLPAWWEMGLPADSGRNAEKSLEPETLSGMPQSVTISGLELSQKRWDPGFVIIDARSAEEYYGEIDSTERVGTGGHVEGANYLDYHRLLSDSDPHLIRDDAELQGEFTRAGMDYSKTAVFYCGSGIRASLSYLVARHLGYSALLYDGSMEEWEMLGLPLIAPVPDPRENGVN